MRFGLVIAFILASILPAAAQTPTDEWIFGENGEDIVLEVGGGILTRPEYESSDDYTLRPWPVVDLNFLRLPYLGTFGGGPESGLKFSPSFRIISERDDDDHSDLTGLGDVDLAVEVGGTAAYRYEMLRGVFTIRRGFGGHEGFVGETGVDLITEPVPKLDFTIGPRVHFADSDYLETDLGGAPAQSAASGLPIFDPDGGVKGFGVEAGAQYALTRHWSVVGKAGYERLVGDAADSPITGLGSEDQFTAALGATYRFGLDVFD